MTRSILLSGFRPFGGAATNPSQELVEWVRRAPGAPAVETTVLDVEYDRAWEQLRQAVERSRPAAVLSLGVSVEAPGIRLERIARNLDDSALQDEAGVVRRARVIAPGAPATLTTRLPVDDLATALRRRDIPASISDDAGRYVCNHIFYRMLHELAPTVAAGFVHVPPFREMLAGAGRDTDPRGVGRSIQRRALSVLVYELSVWRPPDAVD